MGEPKGFLVLPIGFNPSDELRSLEVDASDNLKVVMGDTSLSGLLTELQQKLETADLEIVSSILSTGGHGWIGGAWQRQPMPFGYSNTVVAQFNNTNLSAGTNILDGTATPAGEVHIITNIAIRYDGTSPPEINAQLVIDGVVASLYNILIPTSGLYYDRQGYWPLGASDFVRFIIDGATAGDDAFFRYTGFSIDIDQ